MAKSLLTFLSESCVQPGIISKKHLGQGRGRSQCPRCVCHRIKHPNNSLYPSGRHKLSVGACRSPWPVEDFLICCKTGCPHPVFLQDGLSENLGLA